MPNPPSRRSLLLGAAAAAAIPAAALASSQPPAAASPAMALAECPLAARWRAAADASDAAAMAASVARDRMDALLRSACPGGLFAREGDPRSWAEHVDTMVTSTGARRRYGAPTIAALASHRLDGVGVFDDLNGQLDCPRGAANRARAEEILAAAPIWREAEAKASRASGYSAAGKASSEAFDAENELVDAIVALPPSAAALALKAEIFARYAADELPDDAAEAIGSYGTLSDRTGIALALDLVSLLRQAASGDPAAACLRPLSALISAASPSDLAAACAPIEGRA